MVIFRKIKRHCFLTNVISPRCAETERERERKKERERERGRPAFVATILATVERFAYEHLSSFAIGLAKISTIAERVEHVARSTLISHLVSVFCQASIQGPRTLRFAIEPRAGFPSTIHYIFRLVHGNFGHDHPTITSRPYFLVSCISRFNLPPPPSAPPPFSFTARRTGLSRSRTDRRSSIAGRAREHDTRRLRKVEIFPADLAASGSYVQLHVARSFSFPMTADRDGETARCLLAWFFLRNARLLLSGFM